MTPARRCDEIVRMIDEALETCTLDGAGTGSDAPVDAPAPLPSI